MDTPYSLTILDEVTSTQDLARQKASSGAPALVVARRQRQGRGRGGSEWVSAPRAVAASLGFACEWDPDRWSLIPLLAGVAASRAVGPSLSLKWPNDLMVGEDKVGGILVESAHDLVVAGMGLNLYWSEPPEGVSALYQADPGPDLGPSLARSWADYLLGMIEGGPDNWPRYDYESACSTLGQEITWEPNGRGRAVAIADDGSLEVELPEGELRSLSSGAIRHIRPV